MYNINNGTTTISGGTITGDGIGVDADSGSVNITGGTISGGNCGVDNFDSTVTISGGSISGGNCGVENNSTVTISGGTISGGNYCVENNSTVTITGGTITGGDITDGTITYNAYGVYNNSTVTISGGTITGDGFGVYALLGTVTISGGTISSNAYAVGNENGTATISGGTITGKVSDINNDIGILTLTLGEDGTGATFPGGIKVRGTTLAEILGEGAAYWQGDQQVNLTEDQTEITDGDVVIKAACSHTGDKNYTDNGDGTHTWSCTGCNSNITEDHQFNKETLLCNCGAVSSEAAVVVSKNGKIVSAHTTLNAAITVVADATDEDKAVVKVLKPIELTAQQYIDSGVFTLDLNDQTITGSGDQVFYISGGTVTIDDSGENGTITGSYDGMHVAGGNVEISGGTISGYDYGVYNINNGTTTISGGSITGGTRGVVSNSGIVTISGGSISGGSYGVMNTKGTATISGGTITSGRIAVQNNDGTASITGGTITGGDITDGTITYNAFGVYNINNGTTTISGGTITGDGIGVDADSGSVNITGGTISGGNCGVDNFDSTVTISGGSISGGNCGVENNSTVTISGGTISGGNYCVENNSTVTITGGTITGGDITDGTITYNAYGVYNNSTVTISGGTITGDGFGVYALLGTVTISGGTISSNAYAVGNENGTATISGGTITGKVSDINNDIGILTLTLGEDGTGATFPGGIKVRGTTLAEILGEGAAYWQGDQQVNLTEDQTEITDGDVVIKAAVCDHSGNENADDGDCTTELICSVCGKAALEAKTAHEYGANHFCTVEYCNAEEPVYVAFHSLSLKGNIGVNYYLHIDESILADETGFMRFVTPRGGTVEIPISQAAQRTAGGKTYYGFTATVAAKEMTDIVQGQYIYSNGTSTVKEYSVKQYADIILANESNSAAFTKAQPLVQAMLTYGAYAQQEFGYNTDRLAGELADVSTVTAETLASFAGNGPQGTTLAPLYASSLLLKTETTMRLIFAPDATVSELTATMNGKAMDVTMKSGYALVNISSISAKDLDAAYTVTINDGAETADVTYTPMTYCYNVLKDSSGTFGATTQDLVKALYLYNQAANTYFS